LTSSAANVAPAFFFIRHGETDWNREGRLQGQHDVPLNPLGRDQAAGAGRILKDLLAEAGLDARRARFVASPLGRARETMERVRLAVGLPPDGYAIDDRLKEVAFGAWEGLTWGELKRSAPVLVKARRAGKWAFTPPGGESYAALARRLEPWLAGVASDDIVVAHGGVARALLQLRGLIEPHDAPELDIKQGRVLLFRPDGYAWA
jgi:broad specificity phosphatase PhoE